MCGHLVQEELAQELGLTGEMEFTVHPGAPPIVMTFPQV